MWLVARDQVVGMEMGKWLIKWSSRLSFGIGLPACAMRFADIDWETFTGGCTPDVVTQLVLLMGFLGFQNLQYT